ncbi:hypothetical protein D3C73_577140 [compost metagenome]
MGIGPADAKRTYGGPERSALGCPIGQRIIHIKGGILKFNFGIRVVEVNRGRNLPVLNRQNRFDQACNSGCFIQMADIRLYRADCAIRLVVRTIRPFQCFDLDGIPNLRTRTVGFHHSNRFRLHLGHLECRFDHFSLSVDARRGEPRFPVAVVIDGRPFNHGVNMIAVLNGILQGFQDDDPSSIADHRSL